MTTSTSALTFTWKVLTSGSLTKPVYRPASPVTYSLRDGLVRMK